MAPRVPTVSLTDIAAEMEVTTRTIQNYVRDGMPHRREKDGPRFVARECQRWRREREIEQAVQKERDRQTADGLDKDKEQAEKTRVERLIREIDLEERRREVVPIALYRERNETFVGNLAAVTMGQLQRFERDIVRATTAADARRLTQRIQAALMQGAQEYADTLEAEIAATEPTEDAA